MDWGKDHYATVTWSDAPDNRRIAIAWMSNWQYANDVPTSQSVSYTHLDVYKRQWMSYKADGVFKTKQEVYEYLSKYDVQIGAPGVGRIRYKTLTVITLSILLIWIGKGVTNLDLLVV